MNVLFVQSFISFHCEMFVIRLLMEYEEHLRNTLKKGMDAESYSLHTFEALLTQSMENLGEFGNVSRCCK